MWGRAQPRVAPWRAAACDTGVSCVACSQPGGGARRAWALGPSRVRGMSVVSGWLPVRGAARLARWVLLVWWEVACHRMWWALAHGPHTAA